MATVYGIIKQNGGFINVSSEPGKGATFTIYLPRHNEAAKEIQAEVPVKPVVAGHETILLVEDEPSMLRMTARMLEQQGYTVLAAGSPGEAVRLAVEHATRISLIVTDVVMPDMNGLELAQKLQAIYPHLRCLFMSGYAADAIARLGVADKAVNFIQKPFVAPDLAVKVRQLLDAKGT